MFIFEDTLDEKRGKISKDPNHLSNVDFVMKNYNFDRRNTNMSHKIKDTRQRFIRMIQRHNAELLKDLTQDQLNTASLEYLDSIIKANRIEGAGGARKQEWKQAEIDIANGFQKLLHDNFFSYQDKNGNILKVDDNKLQAKQVGGAKESDVKIFRLDDERKCVYIESKLDFMSAEYFKFKLRLNGSQLTYDHKFFLGGLEGEEKERMNDLFKQIDLNGFLNDLLNRNEVKVHWKIFLQNIKSVFERLKTDADFKDFTEGVSLPSSFPGNTDVLLNIFDIYCKHYIEKYDSIVRQIYDSYGGNKFMGDVSQYTIDEHYSKGHVDFDEVFYGVDELMAQFHSWNDMLSNDDVPEEIVSPEDAHPYDIDEDKILQLSDELKTIEIKLTRIMDSAKINDPRELLHLKNKDKLMYFFKAFISSVGRKNSGQNPVVGLYQDQLGNMQITPDVELQNSRLSEMITDYYVKKDKCIYIQISDIVYQFSNDSNLFQIPNLPTMKECITKYLVKIGISNDVDEISLHIRAIPFKREMMSKFNLISFKEKDANFIEKKKASKIVIK